MNKLITVLIISLVVNCSAFVDVDEPVIIFVGENNPVLEDRDAITIYPDIFISSMCHKNCEMEEIIAHEMVHWKAQRNDPMWLTRYAIDKEFRLNEEAKGYAAEIHKCEEIGHEYSIEANINDKVDFLTTGIYGNVSKEYVKNLILKYY